MAKQIIICLMVLSLASHLQGQQRLGINTSTPLRILELASSSEPYLRVHSSNGQAGMELVRGLNAAAVDWKITNDNGALKFIHGDDNFSTTGSEAMRIGSGNNIGIATTIPQAKLHIDAGSPIVFGGFGYIKLGSHTGVNLIADHQQIQALNNGNPSPLSIQSNGGDTHFGSNGGNTYMAMEGGNVAIGTNTISSVLTVEDDNMQLHLRNEGDADANPWYIGVSNSDWQAGDHQLLFSPTSSSSDAAFRLMDYADNDGINAPVMVYTNSDHTLLLDGNEIDTRNTPLYINHNRDEHTLINPSGGMVGIGTENPQAMLHIVGSGDVLTLQHDNALWHLSTQIGGHENFTFTWDDVNSPYAEIDGLSGQWMYLSDRNKKKDILPLESVIDKMKQLVIYHYAFNNDTTKTKHSGVIAQEVEGLFPEMVYTTDGQYGVAYAQLAVVGVKAIQEQQMMIDLLKEKIKKLKALQHPDAQSTMQVGSN